MRIKKVKKRRDLPVLFLKIALAIALGVLSVNFVDSRIRPTVINTLMAQARATTLSYLNSAVEETLTELPLDYAGVVTVEKSQSGQVTSIQTDIPTLTLFQTRVSEKLNSRLYDMGMREGKISLGSLSGLTFLIGRGPNVGFRISPLGFVHTDLKSEFTSAGINQTRHRIVLTVTANVSAIIPTFSTDTSVTADYCLAETIIVGVTPDFFVSR